MQHRVGLTLLCMLNTAFPDAENDVFNSAGRLNDVEGLQEPKKRVAGGNLVDVLFLGSAVASDLTFIARRFCFTLLSPVVFPSSPIKTSNQSPEFLGSFCFVDSAPSSLFSSSLLSFPLPFSFLSVLVCLPFGDHSFARSVNH